MNRLVGWSFVICVEMGGLGWWRKGSYLGVERVRERGIGGYEGGVFCYKDEKRVRCK